MSKVYSYVVRYDSGFAPNPFYEYCSLATCKPEIRRTANVGDWVVGTGSNAQRVRLGGHLVYAMRVTETMSFDQYNADPRFERKKPFRRGSRKQSCGDNIYHRDDVSQAWNQRDSFHSNGDGHRDPKHTAKDTRVNRVLISDEFTYFGGEGPVIPCVLTDADGRHLCKEGVGYYVFRDPWLLRDLTGWLQRLGCQGYCGAPHEWISLRDH